MEDLKIGITINIKDINTLYWLSDAGNSALSLYDLLIKKYNVTLLNVSPINLKPSYLSDYTIDLFDEKFLNMDLIIVVDGQPNLESIELFKDIKTTNKIITYKFKNEFVISNEESLNNDSLSSIYQYENYFDEVWYPASQYETNKNFYSTLYKTDVIVVPFIWNKKHLDNLLNNIDSLYEYGNESIKKNTTYQPKKEKTIGIIEKNDSFSNTCLIPLMITEESYRKNDELISNVIIDNGKNIKGNKRFISLFRTFNLFDKGKIQFEHQYNVYFLVTQLTDVIVGHQLLNPFNHIYLDLVYMGYPLLHNSYMCKDLGYYYDGQDINKASELLNWILNNHDNNQKEYILRNSETLNKYYIENSTLLENYDMLIKNLYSGNNENSKLTFDSINNNYI